MSTNKFPTREMINIETTLSIQDNANYRWNGMDAGLSYMYDIEGQFVKNELVYEQQTSISNYQYYI